MAGAPVFVDAELTTWCKIRPRIYERCLLSIHHFSSIIYVRLNIGLFDRHVTFVIIIYIIACIYEMKYTSVNIHLIWQEFDTHEKIFYHFSNSFSCLKGDRHSRRASSTIISIFTPNETL